MSKSKLIAPYGGKLVNLVAEGEEREELVKRAETSSEDFDFAHVDLIGAYVRRDRGVQYGRWDTSRSESSNESTHLLSGQRTHQLCCQLGGARPHRG